MKKIILTICFLMITTFAFAQPKEITNEAGEIIEYQITVSLTPEEYKAALTDMIDVEEWVSNAIHNKSRREIDKIVEKSGRGSRFTPVSEKRQIIKDLDSEGSLLLESAEDREIRLEPKEDLRSRIMKDLNLMEARLTR